MMKKPIFIMIACVLLRTTVSIAQTEVTPTEEVKFTPHSLIDVTWTSQYMLDGFKVGEDSPAWQIALKTKVFTTDFSVMLWAAIQEQRKLKQYDEYDFFILYSHDFLSERTYKVNLHGFYDYWIFPNSEPYRNSFGTVISDATKKGNKFQVGVSFPELLPVGPSHIIPSYNVYTWVYYEQDRRDMDMSGTRHELLFEYDQSIPVFIPRATYQYLGGTANINYNSGAFGVDPGLSHSVVSVRTGVYAFSSIFETSLNHQWTYESTLDVGNEMWGTLSFIRKF